MNNYDRIRIAVSNGDFTLSVAEKIFKRFGYKTEIVALVHDIHPDEVTDEMSDSYEEISTKRIKMT